MALTTAWQRIFCMTCCSHIKGRRWAFAERFQKNRMISMSQKFIIDPIDG